MAGHLQRAIETIKKEILSLGAMVEDRLQKSIYAVKSEDLDDVVVVDGQIGHLEAEGQEIDADDKEKRLFVARVYSAPTIAQQLVQRDDKQRSHR